MTRKKLATIEAYTQAFNRGGTVIDLIPFWARIEAVIFSAESDIGDFKLL